MKSLKDYSYLILFLFSFFLFVKLLQSFLFLPIIEAAYKGESLDYLNKIILYHKLKNPINRDLIFYQNEIPRFINRIWFIGSLSISFVWIIFRNNSKIFKDFAFQERSGIAISVLRIGVFILILLSNFPLLALDAISIGNEAIQPIIGWNRDIIELLTNRTLVLTLGFLFTLFSLGSLFGYLTNFMIKAATFIGFFLMAIPQFYGKIDHYHSLWFIMLILSFSNSGNSFSIDAWKSNQIIINRTKNSLYGFSSFLIMIYIGICYYFPGFWKFVFSGFEWAFGNNLQMKLYSKWLELEGWTPFFRIDKYPFLYKSAAFTTLIIELGFIFAIFFRKARVIFVVCALLFHFSVAYFMKIEFYGLIILYLIFINWEFIFRKLRVWEKIDQFSLKSENTSYILSKKIIFLASFVFFGNLLAGGLLINSWPFAVYPTFASIEKETVPSILIVALDNEQNRIQEIEPFFDQSFRNVFVNTSKLRAHLNELLGNRNLTSTDFKTLKKILIESSIQNPSAIEKIEYYKIEIPLDPELRLIRNQEPVLLFEDVLSDK